MGNVKNLSKTGGPKITTTEKRLLDVLLTEKEEPKMYVSILSLHHKMSKISVRRILRTSKMFVYKVHLHQYLNEDNPNPV